MESERLEQTAYTAKHIFSIPCYFKNNIILLLLSSPALGFWFRVTFLYYYLDMYYVVHNYVVINYDLFESHFIICHFENGYFVWQANNNMCAMICC